jgi:hypothetical protein
VNTYSVEPYTANIVPPTLESKCVSEMPVGLHGSWLRSSEWRAQPSKVVYKVLGREGGRGEFTVTGSPVDKDSLTASIEVVIWTWGQSCPVFWCSIEEFGGE